MGTKLPTPGEFELGAGALCLDFANTLDGRFEERPTDLLNSYEDILHFAEVSNTVDAIEAGRLRAAAPHHPNDVLASFERGIYLREVIFRIFATLVTGHRALQEDLQALSRALATGLLHGSLRETDERFTWHWEMAESGQDIAFDRPLWPILLSAAEVLQNGDLRRARQCAAADCGVLFLDSTRNQSRQWCSRAGCGNRSRVRRHRERRRVTA